MFHSGSEDLAAAGGAFLNIQNWYLDKVAISQSPNFGLATQARSPYKKRQSENYGSLGDYKLLDILQTLCVRAVNLKDWTNGDISLARRLLQARNSIVVIAQCAQTQIRYKLNYPDLSQAENSWETNSTVIIIFTDGCSHHNDVVDTNIFSPALCTIDTVSQ